MSDSAIMKPKNSLINMLWFRIRENFILIILIMALSLGAGVVFHKLQKPVYTTTEWVNYMAFYEDAKDTDNASGAMNLMSMYIDTMVDFCTTGVVLDRAEYYYTEYLKSNVGIEQFILDAKVGNYNDAYDPATITNREHFIFGNVSAELLLHGDTLEESYIISISVKDGDAKKAKELTRFFALAIDQEGRDFFTGVKTYVYELVKNTDGVSVQGESSLTRTLVIFALAGIALCALIIYLKVSFDNTVKDKEFMETVSGVSVIAYIEKQENHHARK